MEEMHNIIGIYFRLGFSNKEILECIAHHGFIISLRTLKIILSKLQLFRRKNQSDILEVTFYILNEIKNKAGDMHGYRWMHARCIQHGFVVSEKNVRLLMGIVDPEGLNIRSRRRMRRRAYANAGPNAVWHLDGCDKLAPYGIYIHGCIDGYSRHIIWMEAYYTNKDPALIAGYFVDAIAKLKKCPKVVRADCGTENGTVCEIQRSLRRHHNDSLSGDKSFWYGKSTSNQRIEWFWGLNRKHGIQHWMNVFQDLKDTGLFSGSQLDKGLIQFCFMDMVQETLVNIEKIWDTHKIQHYRNATGPCGRPMIMYNIPEKYGTMDSSVDYDPEELRRYRDICMFKNNQPCSNSVYELCHFIMNEYHIEYPTSSANGCELYTFLRIRIQNLLETQP